MDSFNGIRVDKGNTIFKYDKLQKITVVIRFVELCVLMIILSRFSIQLPFTFKLSGEYFRLLFVTLISPRFVFILGNAIIIILFLKSGKFSEKTGAIDVYAEYVENRQNNQQNFSYENKKQTNRIVCPEYRHGSSSSGKKEREMHRSQSEKLERTQYEVGPRRELRRSMTERCRKSVGSGEKPVGGSSVKDEMSNEEFRRMVEDFIARQQRILREEEEEYRAVVSS